MNAQREAIFGDESVTVQKAVINDGKNDGVMTGHTLAGFCEVEMLSLDGHRHWYPIEDLAGENGEKIVEEEITVDLDEGDVEAEED